MPTPRPESEPMSELLERLTAVETQQANTNKVLDGLATAMTDMVKQVSDLAAALRHPDPAHCTRGEQINKLESRVTSLEQWIWRLAGGLGVLIGMPAIVWTVLQIIKALTLGL